MCRACQRRESLKVCWKLSIDADSHVQTVGALLSRAYTAGGCISGAIFGTGTNGAYIEQVGMFFMPLHWFERLINLSANIPKLAGTAAAARGGQMVINTEWGAFNNSVSHLRSQSSLSDSYLIISALAFPQLPLTTQSIDSVSIRNTRRLRNSFLECIWAKLFATSYLP